MRKEFSGSFYVRKAVTNETEAHTKILFGKNRVSHQDSSPICAATRVQSSATAYHPKLTPSLPTSHKLSYFVELRQAHRKPASTWECPFEVGKPRL